eukprot:TRINITY_DN391_c0_g2_i1.p2 TRINITY_DN391_c0_g2~~TRINITY_DN391_c0_g2_i1.p2  ORF type:complete len:109 (+),score=49.30 TRINITY_DN391_c0_g2_i1:75-401(+)
MKYMAAYLLAQLGGKAAPAQSDIETVLSAAGAACDAGRCGKLLELLEGKDIDELVAEGSKKMAAAGGGGRGGGAAAPAAGGGEAKKEEAAPAPVEASEEEDCDFGLFD